MSVKAFDDVSSTKSRILNHMNTVHSESVCHYAQHYARIPVALASTAKLTDITLTRLTLSVAASSDPSFTTDIFIPLNPRMGSIEQSRERLRAMAEESLQKLGGGTVIVERWVPPGLGGILVFLGVVFGYWSFLNGEAAFGENGLVRCFVFANRLDPLADLLRRLSIHIFCLIVAIHVAEVVWICRTRLSKYGVRTGSAVWWGYVTGTMLEGYGNTHRFDIEVEEIKRKKMAKVHNMFTTF